MGIPSNKKRDLFRIKHGVACVTGADHLDYPLGYQDAHFVLNQNDLLVAVICDGCSTTEDELSKNQVGAAIGAEIISRRLFKRLRRMGKVDPQKALEDCEHVMRFAFGKFFGSLKNKLADFRIEEFVAKHLTFTVIGLIILKERFWFFGCGDGCYGVNDSPHILKATSYLNPLMTGRGKKRLIEVYEKGTMKPENRLWIATDGLISLLRRDGGMSDFLSFLNDENTGNYSVNGIDQTFKPFNLVAARHVNVFNDDTTVVVAYAERLLSTDRIGNGKG